MTNLKVGQITQDSLLIGAGANVILHHVLLLTQIAVELKVLRGRRFFGTL